MARSQCIIAVDVPTRAAAGDLLDRLDPFFDFYKIGLQLYLKEGAAVVELFKNRGKKVFLDLKLHDIPATVGKAAASVASLEPDILTVHASGGRAMIEQAVRQLPNTNVVAVTVLTSLAGDDAQRMWHASPEELALRWLAEAQSGGAAGWVSSVWEVPALRQVWGDGIAVTPGIRLPGGSTQDQQRVATPAKAIAEGSNYLVLGRAITQADDLTGAIAALDDDLQQ